MAAIFTKLSRMLSNIQWKQLAVACCVSVILLTANMPEANLDPGVQSRLNTLTEQGETGRPRTTGQWQAENEVLQGKPVEQAKRIGKEAADAVEEMAEIYPQNVKTLTPGVDNGRLPKDN
ncbi:hypothetical protein PN498_11880 [Oscillatoria sp. CS-180]|uniref:hypothetical protein n=1 Tax=Oscillatoria sp. CS-180 TaxID=3021720 RepID=UPI00232A97A1|nr:hypothetical protein [Oscillatoria sp. CS-180]MDB9526692.1 hypothetical protein [Oscillatoria sp. CS-180]